MHISYRASVAAVLALAALACSESTGGGDEDPVLSIFEGVIAGTDGAENGSIDLTISTTGTSSGSFEIGSTVTPFTSVTVAGQTVTATGGGYTFTGTKNGVVIDGTYTGGAGGRVAALEKPEGQTLARFCGSHSGTDNLGDPIGGVFSFVLNTNTDALRGAWTSGVGSPFQGIVSGEAGDDAGQMSGYPGGTVTILPNVPGGTFGGFYDLTSGDDGSMGGAICP